MSMLSVYCFKIASQQLVQNSIVQCLLSSVLPVTPGEGLAREGADALGVMRDLVGP
jgi:hypothetical protein